MSAYWRDFCAIFAEHLARRRGLITTQSKEQHPQLYLDLRVPVLDLRVLLPLRWQNSNSESKWTQALRVPRRTRDSKPQRAKHLVQLHNTTLKDLPPASLPLLLLLLPQKKEKTAIMLLILLVMMMMMPAKLGAPMRLTQLLAWLVRPPRLLPGPVAHRQCQQSQ
jgi:hypothetical protein